MRADALSSIDPSQLPYRPCVGIMLLNAENKVFVGARIDNTAEAWQMPQGGIDEGEEPYQAALRELREETSVTQVALIAALDDWLYYDLPAELVPKLWGGCYRGQKQKWFAMRLTAEDTHINIHTKNPEFRDWQWIAPEQLPELIVPFKKALYTDLVAAFHPVIHPS